MNVFNAIGRITKDIELKQTVSGNTFVRFSLAVRRDKENADFINCVAWNKTAEMLRQYCNKGQQIGITGEIRTGSYKNEKGETISTVDCLVNRVDLLSNKTEASKEQTRNTGITYSENYQYKEEDFPF